jgi:hypothetical protein
MNEQEEFNERMKKASVSGDLAALERALADGADAGTEDSWALRRAAESGHAECVRLLVAVSEPTANGSEALCWAAEGDHVECVRILLPASDPKMDNSYALRIAAHEGHADCVALLLPASDPLATDAKGLDAAGLARARGHVEVAGMIEAFIEARALSEATQNAKPAPRVKSAL